MSAANNAVLCGMAIRGPWLPSEGAADLPARPQAVPQGQGQGQGRRCPRLRGAAAAAHGGPPDGLGGHAPARGPRPARWPRRPA
eukprot:11011051-Alexandrium_andersonii.AAC.1